MRGILSDVLPRTIAGFWSFSKGLIGFMSDGLLRTIRRVCEGEF